VTRFSLLRLGRAESRAIPLERPAPPPVVLLGPGEEPPEADVQVVRLSFDPTPMEHSPSALSHEKPLDSSTATGEQPQRPRSKELEASAGSPSSPPAPAATAKAPRRGGGAQPMSGKTADRAGVAADPAAAPPPARKRSRLRDPEPEPTTPKYVWRSKARRSQLDSIFGIDF
jgi:hypothetical protein